MCVKAKSNHPYCLHNWVLCLHVDHPALVGLLLDLPQIIVGIGYGFH